MASSDPLYLQIPAALRTISQGTEQQPHASKPHTLALTYTLRTRKIFRDQVADDRSDFQSRSQSGLWRKDQPTITAYRYHRRPPYRNPATPNVSLEGTSPSVATLPLTILCHQVGTQKEQKKKAPTTLTTSETSGSGDTGLRHPWIAGNQNLLDTSFTVSLSYNENGGTFPCLTDSQLGWDH